MAGLPVHLLGLAVLFTQVGAPPSPGGSPASAGFVYMFTDECKYISGPSAPCPPPGKCKGSAAVGTDMPACLSLAPNNRGTNIDTTKPTIVFFRPEVKSISRISEKESEFDVVIEKYYFWKDPAIAADPNLMQSSDNTDVLWVPSAEPRQMVDYKVLHQGAVKYIGNLYTVAQMYGPPQMKSANMAFRSIVRYRISNVGEWALDDYPFDTRTLQWDWQNAEVWERRKAGVDFDPMRATVLTGTKRIIYAGASQTNDLSKKIPLDFKTNGDMELVGRTQCSIEDTMSQSGVRQKVPLRRHWEFTLASYGVPVILCSVIGIGSLRVPIGIAMPRFAASVISLLTVATVKRSVDALLPADGQSSILCYWLVLQMVILACCAIETSISFYLWQSCPDGKVLQQYADWLYRRSIPLLFVASFPMAYSLSISPWFLVLSVVVVILAMVIPYWLISRRANELQQQRALWQGLGERGQALLNNLANVGGKITSKADLAPDGVGIEMVTNPVVGPTSSDDGSQAELDEWFGENGVKAFERYDLDCSGTINTVAELEQLCLCVFSQMLSAATSTQFRARYERKLSPDKINQEIAKYAEVNGVCFKYDEFKDWFSQLVNNNTIMQTEM